MYRTFLRDWWKDDACTEPGPGRKAYGPGSIYGTEEAARAACREWNESRYPQDANGNHRGPRGRCMEYEVAGHGR